MKKRIHGVTWEFWSIDRDHYAIRADDIDKPGWSDELQIRLWRRAVELRVKG